jgi:hypothetical protein
METETVRTRILTARRITTGLLAGGILGAVATVHAFAPTTHDTADTQTGARVDVAAERAAELIAKHGCWTGEAPADMAGKFPGHVVVRKTDARLPIYSARLVGPAIDHVFDGDHAGMTVYAFCR